jgi:hypothetical protein
MRKFQKNRKNSMWDTVRNFSVMEDVVDMHRVTLSFMDAVTEAKYQSYAAGQVNHTMQVGTQTFLLFLLAVQCVYLATGATVESGLPRTLSIWYFIAALLLASALTSARARRTRALKPLLGYLPVLYLFFGLVYIGYNVYVLAVASTELDGAPGRVVDFLREEEEGGRTLSSDRIMAIFNEALGEGDCATGDFETMSEVGRLTAWWMFASVSSFMLVTAVVILDAITMASFKRALVTSAFVVLGTCAVFRLNSGPATVFVLTNLVVHCWTVRYTEQRNRHDFVRARKEMARIEIEVSAAPRPPPPL